MQGRNWFVRKLGSPQKSTKKKIKTRMGNSTGDANKKKSTKTGPIKKNKGNMLKHVETKSKT